MLKLKWLMNEQLMHIPIEIDHAYVTERNERISSVERQHYCFDAL